MLLLLSGLALFLGVHSLRIVADGLRTRAIAKIGPYPWKGLFTLASAAGLFLIVLGYGQARDETPLLMTQATARHAAFALTWLGFIGVVAAYWPRNHIKQAVGDPMIAGVSLWALGHVLVKTTPAGLALFGAFLVWALFDYASLRARASAANTPASQASALQTFLTLVAGSVVWMVFVLFLHKALIGVSPIL